MDDTRDDGTDLKIPLKDCSLAGAAQLLGDRWTLLILRELFYGVRRFETMREELAIPRTMLSNRLAKLVEAGLLDRAPYRRAGQRGRFEYRLTDKGLGLFPVLIALMQWGDKYFGRETDPPLVLRHRTSGKRVRAALISEDGEVADPRELRAGRPKGS